MEKNQKKFQPGCLVSIHVWSKSHFAGDVFAVAGRDSSMCCRNQQNKVWVCFRNENAWKSNELSNRSVDTVSTGRSHLFEITILWSGWQCVLIRSMIPDKESHCTECIYMASSYRQVCQTKPKNCSSLKFKFWMSYYALLCTLHTRQVLCFKHQTCPRSHVSKQISCFLKNI